MAAGRSRLISDDLIKVLELVKGSDSIELKLTLPEFSYRSAAAALGADPLEAQIRQVFLRHARPGAQPGGHGRPGAAVQGRGDDSVIKLRPVVPSELPSDLRGSPNLVVEVAVMPGGYGCFASLKSQLPKPAVRARRSARSRCARASTSAGNSRPRPKRPWSSSRRSCKPSAHEPVGRITGACRYLHCYVDHFVDVVTVEQGPTLVSGMFKRQGKLTIQDVQDILAPAVERMKEHR